MEHDPTATKSSLESDKAMKGLEQFGQILTEKLRTEQEDDFGRAFEAPRTFEDEDAKNRQAELSDQINEMTHQIEQVDATITQTTQQLTALPLTIEQQALLTQLNELVAQRERATSPEQQSQLDTRIDETTKQLAELPVTTEQGGLLDDILGLMDQREKTATNLQKLYTDLKTK